jgi:acylphosphatase
MASIRVRAFISGRVQGVFFRAETQKQASQLGLTGWVRNLPDGRVELLAEGEEQRVRSLIAWCRTGGPPHARVDTVEELPEAFTGKFDTFSITY